MMKRIEYESDWFFDVDVEKTIGYYDMQGSYDDKSFIKRLPDSLREFLVRFGIDYKKPCENPTEHCVAFHVYGTAHTTTGYELDFYECGLGSRMVSIVIERQPLADNPLFTMWVYY